MALVQILTSIVFPKVVDKFGRKKIFLFSLIIQTLVTIYYGIMNYITNNFYFILTGFINRIIHGIFCCNINIICFVITSAINTGAELEIATGYMELSWMIGLTIGPVVISIFYDIGGYSLPYYVCALICLSGIYAFYQVPQVDESLYKQEQIEKINNNNENIINKEEKVEIVSLFKHPQILLLTGAIIMETNSIDFYIPSLVNHLNETWGVSTSTASLFFLSSTISYAIILQKIHDLINFFGHFPLVCLGLILTSITCFIIAPISFLPYSYWTILSGIIIMGVNGCFIIVPSFIELNNFAKVLFPDNVEMQNIIGSSFFNFSFYIADFFSPIIGSFFYTHYNFETSAYATGFITFMFWLTFSSFYRDKIKLFFMPKNFDENIEREKQSNIIQMSDKDSII
jgi:MFS family permease